MRNRAWRRKRTEAVWNHRCKEHMYMALIPSNEKVTFVSKQSGRVYAVPKSWRFPLNWKDFKSNVKWSKYLRDQGKIQSDKWEQMDNHHKNKLNRRLSRKLINEGLKEWDDMYLEDVDYDSLFDNAIKFDSLDEINDFLRNSRFSL